jgi:hypothetical protein
MGTDSASLKIFPATTMFIRLFRKRRGGCL